MRTLETQQPRPDSPLQSQHPSLNPRSSASSWSTTTPHKLFSPSQTTSLSRYYSASSAARFGLYHTAVNLCKTSATYLPRNTMARYSRGRAKALHIAFPPRCTPLSCNYKLLPSSRTTRATTSLSQRSTRPSAW